MNMPQIIDTTTDVALNIKGCGEHDDFIEGCAWCGIQQYIKNLGIELDKIEGNIKNIDPIDRKKAMSSISSLKRTPMTARETRSLKLKARNETLDEAIKIISEI